MIIGNFSCTTRDFADVSAGATVEFECVITQAEHDAFGALTGDFNPIHCDDAYASTTKFHRPICHGLQLTALFSTLSGMLLPGKGSLTLSQEVAFKQAIFPGERFKVRGEVTDVFAAAGVVALKTEIVDMHNRLRVSGRKLVQAREFVQAEK